MRIVSFSCKLQESYSCVPYGVKIGSLVVDPSLLSDHVKVRILCPCSQDDWAVSGSHVQSAVQSSCPTEAMIQFSMRSSMTFEDNARYSAAMEQQECLITPTQRCLIPFTCKIRTACEHDGLAEESAQSNSSPALRSPMTP